MHELWTEKYRPKRLDEVVNQKHVVERLKAWVKEGSMPNMLFAGSPGVGKTTVALCLAKELFGDNWRENFQETNASVTPETPIMLKENGTIKRTDFNYLEQTYFHGNEKYIRPKTLEILSINSKHKPEFRKVSLISRHHVDKIAEIVYEGGKIRTSLNHSVIVIDSDGRLIPRQVGDMNAGDLMITFCEPMEFTDPDINFTEYKSKEMVNFQSSIFRNPKLKTIYKNKRLNRNISWLFGMYLAEGCANIKPNGTNGSIIFTVSADEREEANFIQQVLGNEFDLDATIKPAPSGFDRSRLSSLQIRAYNIQLAKFFLDKFYNGRETKNARSKRVPPFMFSSRIECKEAFLKGYMGDACGEWENCLRYSSRSKENLTDIAWLGRMSGVDTSVFDEEVRLVWKLPSYSYIKTDFISAEPIIRLVKSLNVKHDKNYRYMLRHQLYSKKSTRISKKAARGILEDISRTGTDIRVKRLLRFVDSPLSVVKIKSIKIKNYDSYVYDVSVPGSEMFWGGTTPILLHNSDERGIDVVRGRIKDFARIKPFNTDFKIIFLDECDSLTPEAQQALRRTMEKFSGVARFIFSCNYSSRIIEPIQSRTAVFRFKNLTEDEVRIYISKIIANEKLHTTEDGMHAICELAEGDLRKAVNLLQASAGIGKITKESVYEVAAQAKPHDVRDMIRLAVAGKFPEARKKLYEMLISQGISGSDIIREIHRQIFDLEIPEIRKLDMIEKTGEFEFRLNQGGSEEIQLEALLAQFLRLNSKDD